MFLGGEVTEKLIMEGKGLPMVGIMGDILDTMTIWGIQHSYEWYMDVLSELAFIANDGIERDNKEVISRCIEASIKAEIHQYYGIDSLIGYQLLTEWQWWFPEMYKRNLPFHEMVIVGEEFIRQRIASINYQSA